MPIGYLITVAVPAAATALAIAPIRRSWAWGQVSWRLGFQVNELPFLVVTWLLAWTALAAFQGDLATPVGAIGLGLAVLTLIGLALLVRRAIQARPAIERALTAGLGGNWRTAIAPEITTRERRRPWGRILLTPLAVRRHDVVRLGNVRFGGAGKQNLLDLYLARARSGTGPCLIHFHGGGYRSGTKNREARTLLYRLASQGWLCVSANYRLAPDARWPAPLIDAKQVITWVREHAHEYGADPSTIFLAGSSAGAHLAAMAALTANQAPLQPGFEAADTVVAGAVCLYGFYGSPTWIDRDPEAPSAPIDCVGTAAPPMLIVHGTTDSFEPVAGARDFVARLRAGAPRSPVVYAELPGAQHAFDLYQSIRFHAVIDAVDAFTAWVRSTRPGDVEPSADLLGGAG